VESEDRHPIPELNRVVEYLTSKEIVWLTVQPWPHASVCFGAMILFRKWEALVTIIIGKHIIQIGPQKKAPPAGDESGN